MYTVFQRLPPDPVPYPWQGTLPLCIEPPTGRPLSQRLTERGNLGLSAQNGPLHQLPVPAPAPEGTYTVKAGDCLWSISQKAYGTGVKWGVIYNANAAIIKNPSDIQIGQVLVIPAV